MVAPLRSMAGFVARLDEINALADTRPGFIWRLQTAEGDATSIRPFEDDLILVNLSVWASLQDLTSFVYASDHRQVMKQRRQWFKRFDGPYVALWWISQDHIPTVEEARERLTHLRTHGETSHAFSFKKSFPSPDETVQQLPASFEECPA